MTREMILIVEDDPSVSQLMRDVLADEGYVSVSAENGRAALDELERGPEPSAIILDLHLPIMDGRAFYREMRARHVESPVLIVSADDAAQACYELHADGSLRKPFDIAALCDELRRCMADHRRPGNGAPHDHQRRLPD